MNSKLPLIVLVDDEVEIINALKRVFRKVSCQLVTFSDPKKAIDFIKNNEPRAVCSDQRMPMVSGLELLKITKDFWPNCQRIMLSAYQDFDNVAQGFNDGVIQRFISKPWNNHDITSIFNQLTQSDNRKSDGSFGGIIAKSDIMKNLFSLIKAAAGANVPIFINGQTGTGKELVAKACHNYSYRSDSPFVAINCSNLSENLIESQLFGHKKGAFTGAIKDQSGYIENAGSGTLFLDEITTLPLPLQAKLLRVIQEREYLPVGAVKTIKFEAQIISASSTSLHQAAKQGDFREDLYYRLSVIQLKIPALANRDKDVLLIAEHFLKKFSNEHQKAFQGFTNEAVEFINSYPWPGNVRQLENLLHGVIILNNDKMISKDMLINNLDLDDTSSTETNLMHCESNNLHKDNEPIKSLAEIEKESILSAINQCEGNIIQASKLLEINPSTIYRKMSKW